MLNLMQQIRCDHCGLDARVTLSPAQGLPLTVAQREFGPIFVEECARCPAGGPGACAYFQDLTGKVIETGFGSQRVVAHRMG